MEKRRICFCPPDISEVEISNVVEALRVYSGQTAHPFRRNGMLFRKNCIEEISREIENLKSRIIEKRNNKSLIRFLSDTNLKKGISLLIYLIVILLILLPLIARNAAKNKDIYNIVYKDGGHYAVIYSDGKKNIVKRCEIDNDTIEIDDNSFTIYDSKNIEYNNMKFTNVIITASGWAGGL